MPKIELIYDSTCPNIEKARERIREVLSELNMPHEWIEWDRANSEAPDYVNRYGSPTILVDGRDVANITDQTAGDSCRLYRKGKDGVEGLPSPSNIKQAIVQNKKKVGSKNLLASLVAIPAVVVSFLPFLSCPLCWPLYTSVLGAMGLSFFNYTPYLFSITLAFLLIALISVWYSARKVRSSYSPLWLAVVSSIAILVGKFLILTLWIVVPGVMALVASVFWNMMLISRKKEGCCCVEK